MKPVYMIFKAPYGKRAEGEAELVTSSEGLKDAFLSSQMLLKYPTGWQEAAECDELHRGTTKDWLEVVTYEHGRGIFIERFIIV